MRTQNSPSLQTKQPDSAYSYTQQVVQKEMK